MIFADEVKKVAWEVRMEGRLGVQAEVGMSKESGRTSHTFILTIRLPEVY